jgi:hypothetical protein|tara:strand:+ start:1834 stop:2121 length:288 start_codon:yes stop_codon:yes gene_type:complete
MPTDIILANMPFATGEKTIIYRSEYPKTLTWDFIFSFVHKKTKVPIKFLGAKTYKGERISGNGKTRPPFVYENYRMSSLNGELVSAAYITILLVT